MSNPLDICPFPGPELFDNALVGCLLVRGGRIENCNDALAAMLEYPDKAGIIGRPLLGLVHPRHQYRLNPFAEGYDTAMGKPGFVALKCMDGEPLICEYLRISESGKPDDATRMHLIMFIDVNAYHQHIEELESRMIDLEEAKLAQEDNSEILATMVNQLKVIRRQRIERERMKGVLELAGAACHEFGQPLQAAMNETGFAMSTVDKNSETYECLEAIQESVARMADIVERIRKLTTYKAVKYDGSTNITDLGLTPCPAPDKDPVEDEELDGPKKKELP